MRRIEWFWNKFCPTIAMLVVATPATAEMLRVDQNDPNCSLVGAPYCTIQTAVDAAVVGDTVEVAAGAYLENVTIGVPDLILRAMPGAVIDGGGGGAVVDVTEDGVTIAGFEVRNGDVGIRAIVLLRQIVIKDNHVHGNAEQGIFLSADQSDVLNNRVHDNGKEGIRLGRQAGDDASVGNTIYRNAVFNNGLTATAVAEKAAIHLISANLNDVVANDVHDQPALGASGILLEFANRNNVQWNRLANAFWGIALGAEGSGNYVENNTLVGGLIGVFAQGGANLNHFTRNRVSDAAANGFVIISEDNVLDRNTALGNGEGYMIAGTRNELTDNLARDSDRSGFDAGGKANTYLRNVARGNGVHGFEVHGLGGDTYRGNVARQNGLSGFSVALGGNGFEDNRAQDNGRYGYLDVSTDGGTAGTGNLYSGNICKQNDPGGSSPAGLCTGQ